MYQTKLPIRPKIAMVSLGCSKNTVDTEHLMGRFFYGHFDLEADPSRADAVIVNTCGFIQPAIDETRRTLQDILALKDQNPAIKVYAMGCYVSRGVESWDRNFKGLDGVFSLKDTPAIVERVGRDLNYHAAPKPMTTYYPRPVSSTLPHYAYLKIAEGCNRTCTYCTIPSIRGANASRPIEDLVAEAAVLIGRGARELILVAQDTTAYGVDLYGEPALLRLLKHLADLRELSWIRLFYAYPDYIDSALETFLLECPKMVPYLDLPIQHSHAEVLRRMNRKNTFATYDALFARLRSANPDYALRTTVICGFPGETQEEFEHVRDYTRAVGFDRMGVFQYIREPGTPADRLPGHLPGPEIESRYRELMIQQQELHFERNQSLIEKTLPAMIDAPHPDGGYVGRTYRDAPDIDAVIRIHCRKTLKAGMILPVRVTAAEDYDLVGRAG